MKKYKLFLAGGYFPEGLRQPVQDDCVTVFSFRAQEGDRVLTDFHLFDMLGRMDVFFPKGNQVSRYDWQSFEEDYGYYHSLTRHAAEAHIFAYPALPDHRQRLMSLNRACNDCGCKYFLHLYG